MPVTIKELEFFFSTHKFEKKEIKLNESETVLDPKATFESHLNILRANSGKKHVMPYYNRLVRIYNILKYGRQITV